MEWIYIANVLYDEGSDLYIKKTCTIYMLESERVVVYVVSCVCGERERERSRRPCPNGKCASCIVWLVGQWLIIIYVSKEKVLGRKLKRFVGWESKELRVRTGSQG